MDDALFGKVDGQVVVIDAKAIVEEDDSLLRDVESCRGDDGQITMFRRSLHFD